MSSLHTSCKGTPNLTFSSLLGYGSELGCPQEVTTLLSVAARRCILRAQLLILSVAVMIPDTSTRSHFSLCYFTLQSNIPKSSNELCRQQNRPIDEFWNYLLNWSSCRGCVVVVRTRLSVSNHSWKKPGWIKRTLLFSPFHYKHKLKFGSYSDIFKWIWLW